MTETRFASAPGGALGPAPGECAGGQFHPLELIPYFRRFRRTPVRDLLYTFIWSSGLGLAFVAIQMALSGGLPTARSLMIYLVLSNFVGYAIHGLFRLGTALGVEDWSRRNGYAARVAYYTLVPLAAVLAAFQAGSLIFHLGFVGWLGDPGWIVSIAATSIVISIILSAIFFWREREARAQARYDNERARAERVEREAALANLRALQAQIEPHFLFNTLANAASLVDSDAPKAKRMLESFIRFLRASLAATRAQSTTLGAEAALIGAYLDVLQVRMGARVRYAIDVPAELAGFCLPPMLLQPVVENAIRHGLEPKVEGGEVAFRARSAPGEVVIEVCDSGVGFAPTTRGGVGLANLRERLRGIYGERASLAIGDNPGGGTLVRLRLPA